MSGPRARWYRAALVALSMLAVLAAALVWPAVARGDAWWEAKWAAWPGALGTHPSTADTRSWTALPKEYQAVEINAPKDGTLHLQTDGGDRTISVRAGTADRVIRTRAASDSRIRSRRLMFI